MKTRLNILSILILSIFIYAIGYEFYLGSVSFRQGFREGMESRTQVRHGVEEAASPSWGQLGEKHTLTLMLDTKADYPVDSIYNRKTGTYLPMEYETIQVYSKESMPLHILLLMPFLFVLTIILLPTLFIYFWKVLSAIKSAKIFTTENIHRLRVIGFCFCMLAFMVGLVQYLTLLETKKLIDVEGYTLVSGEWFASSLWIYGLIAFLIAEVFAIGLKMKEEQELTI